MPVKKGDKIKVEYKGTLEDGTEFDSSEKHGQPLEFKVGEGKLIKKFEEAVEGMEKGEEKEIEVEAADGYGAENPDLIRDFPIGDMPKDKLKPGVMLAVSMPNGGQLPAKVVEVGDETVKIDLNHPLAGKKLKFWIKVVEIE